MKKGVLVVLLAIVVTVFILPISFIMSADAKNIVKKATANGMRIELNILSPEPFYTTEEVATKKIKEGMLIIGGAEPVPPEANSHPNHHLVVHIFDAKTGKAITTAKVSMSFQQLDEKGNMVGKSVKVPIAIMQAIGKGVESTHYGNNVVMPDGSYSVTVVANGKKVDFKVTLSKDDTTPSGKMDMH
jgi:hypothetical protein